MVAVAGNHDSATLGLISSGDSVELLLSELLRRHAGQVTLEDQLAVDHVEARHAVAVVSHAGQSVVGGLHFARLSLGR